MLKSINEHKNILKYINSWYDSDQNIYIIIEELCRGGNINSNYKYIQKPKIKLIKKWLKDILTALDYLHSHNIIHHDLKCDNIYLDRISGNLKIGCIGYIESLPSGSETFDKYIGTPEFMAPEVNEGKYSFKADIYSLGLSLLELLTVQKPYKECEGALNIYVNKKKGIMPECLKLITDKGIKDFIVACLNKENKRPTAKELLENNNWLNNKNNYENNSIIEIKGALRQKNFYLHNRLKSGGNIAMRKTSHNSVVKYNSKIFNLFSLNSKKLLKSNCNNSGKLKIESNIKNGISSSFSKKNLTFNKSKTENNLSNILNNKEMKNDAEINIELINFDSNSNNSNINSNNNSRNCSGSNLINLNKVVNNNLMENKPIIKERNNTNLNYNRFNMGENRKKYFSPERDKSKEILIPNLNLKLIKVNKKNSTNINSFREATQNKISSNTSSIKSINILYDESEYENYAEIDDNDYINYNIVYSIRCNDNTKINCEYNYERDSIEIIINNLKEIMNIDANDIILLKNDFSKKLHTYMDKKKMERFIQKYDIIINKFKMLGTICKKFDRIINDKIINNNIKKFHDLNEKIKDFQKKESIVNMMNNSIK